MYIQRLAENVVQAFLICEIFSFEVDVNMYLYVHEGTVSRLNFFVASLLTSVID